VTTPPEDAPEGTPGGVTDGKAQPSDMNLPGKEAPAGKPPAADTPAAKPAAKEPPTAEQSPAEEAPAEENANLPARRGEERLAEPVARTGMFGTTSTGDTSGYGLLQVHRPPLRTAEPPYGGYFDAIAQALGSALQSSGLDFVTAVERVTVDFGELTFYVRREHLLAVMDRLLHDPALRFEIFSGVSGVHYPEDLGRELRAVYHLLSITHNRRVRIEVSAPDADPHIPSVTDVYPAANWHERETWDFFDGHPALTRIEMPDDWPGHPQRKDYPLGGIPVEYRGTKVPPPDERRSYS
jgi:NADH-quinone oxidoreductase subunit C